MGRLVVVFLLAILNAGGSQSATPGVKSCQTETQSGLVDLTPLGNQDGIPRFSNRADPESGYTYSWNPCFAFSESTFCQNVELCQHDTPQDYNLGSDTTATFVNNNTHLFLLYEAVDYVPRKSYIQLICDEEEDGVFDVIGEEPLTIYHFTLRSKYACPGHKPPTPRSLTTAATVTAFVHTTPSPPSPPSPVFNLKTITILLGCILVFLCLLICQVFVGLITRRSESEEASPPYDEKKRKF